MKNLTAQIELALCAYASTKGATVTTSPEGFKLVEVVMDQSLNLTEVATIVAMAIEEELSQ